MRTTVDLPEHLLIEAKKLAAARRMPMTRLFEESVRLYLSEERRRGVAATVSLPVLRDPAPVPGVDLNDTSRLWELD